MTPGGSGQPRRIVVAVSHAESAQPAVVVAGLRDPADPADERVLHAAFDAAAAAGGVLHVVHAWEAPPSAPVAVPRPERTRASMTGVHHDVSAVVARVAEEHPGVPYAVIVLQGDPTAVLEERTRAADLLVIGRLRSRTTAGALLGSTARAVLGRSHCPVLVVHVDWALDRRPGEPAEGAPDPSVLPVLAP